MPSIERESQRIVIAGASSLVGAELKTLLEEGQFSGWDLRLVDEEAAAGTLTEAGGEPVVIQPVDEGSFERARFVFFTGSPQFVETNLAAALAAGAVAIDFTGKISTKDQPSSPWFPKLDEFWSTPIGPKVQPNGTHFWIPSAAAVAATSLSFGLRPVGLKRLSISCSPCNLSGSRFSTPRLPSTCWSDMGLRAGRTSLRSAKLFVKRSLRASRIRERYCRPCRCFTRQRFTG